MREWVKHPDHVPEGSHEHVMRYSTARTWCNIPNCERNKPPAPSEPEPVAKTFDATTSMNESPWREPEPVMTDEEATRRLNEGTFHVSEPEPAALSLGHYHRTPGPLDVQSLRKECCVELVKDEAGPYPWKFCGRFPAEHAPEPTCLLWNHAKEPCGKCSRCVPEPAACNCRTPGAAWCEVHNGVRPEPAKEEVPEPVQRYRDVMNSYVGRKLEQEPPEPAKEQERFHLPYVGCCDSPAPPHGDAEKESIVCDKPGCKLNRQVRDRLLVRLQQAQADLLTATREADNLREQIIKLSSEAKEQALDLLTARRERDAQIEENGTARDEIEKHRKNASGWMTRATVAEATLAERTRELEAMKELHLLEQRGADALRDELNRERACHDCDEFRSMKRRELEEARARIADYERSESMLKELAKKQRERAEQAESALAACREDLASQVRRIGENAGEMIQLRADLSDLREKVGRARQRLNYTMSLAPEITLLATDLLAILTKGGE